MTNGAAKVKQCKSGRATIIRTVGADAAFLADPTWKIIAPYSEFIKLIYTAVALLDAENAANLIYSASVPPRFESLV